MKTKTKKIQSITVLGKRWFQRTYGNTYNTVRVMVDGVTVATLAEEYGYGEYYVQRAQEWLEENGYLKPKPGELLWQMRDRLGFTLEYSAVDVTRERDL